LVVAGSTKDLLRDALTLVIDLVGVSTNEKSAAAKFSLSDLLADVLAGPRLLGGRMGAGVDDWDGRPALDPVPLNVPMDEIGPPDAKTVLVDVPPKVWLGWKVMFVATVVPTTWLELDETVGLESWVKLAQSAASFVITSAFIITLLVDSEMVLGSGSPLGSTIGSGSSPPVSVSGTTS
jgi:hypothetical protein